jgi:hypothetical protein
MTGADSMSTELVIDVIRAAEVDGPSGDKIRHGIWRYSTSGYPLAEGYSRQPLLDACRQLKSLYGVTGHRVRLFREGRDVPDISCPIEAGAATTVSDPADGSIRFRKFQPFDPKRLEDVAPLVLP